MIIGNKTFSKNKTHIMGILNVTPDSFFDGGKYFSLESAVKRALQMVKDGADIIDIGGESTRPEHEPVSALEEISRVVPVIQALKKVTAVPISIDTHKAQTAYEALRAGAVMVNDVWGFRRDNDIANIVAKMGASCCLMANCPYQDITASLKKSIKSAEYAGVPRDKIMLDAGVGFKKTHEENLLTLNNYEEYLGLGLPLLLAVSRKSVIGNTLNAPKGERLMGSVALTALGIAKGCNFIRVHDIKENRQVADMIDAVLSAHNAQRTAHN
ncbi:MAG: dihydropteroate synthase [Firmicutes bacterium]|nr:dihydropteroate synthase [Bacillota bacterium]